MTPLQTGFVALSVFGGAATQRVTGLGFALVASPLLVLVLGPFQGVLLANALTLCLNVFVLAATWRAAEPRRLILLIPAALLAVHFGASVTAMVPAPVLLTLVGALVCAALLVVMMLKKVALFRGWPGEIGAGALSGFMNVTAGVGGPAITLYAVGTEWEQASFVASMQIYFGALNLASIATKGLPSLPGAALPIVAIALAIGLGFGQWLARNVPVAMARQAVILLAFLGASATLAKGLYLLLH